MFQYENVGDSIKDLARTIAIIIFVFFIIIAVVITIPLKGWGLFLSPFVIGIGYGVAWLSGLLLFGFGELISTTVDQTTLLRKLNSKIQLQEERAKVVNEKQRQPAQVTQTASAVQPACTYTDGSWSCTCGQHNPKYITTCACGINKSELEI